MTYISKKNQDCVIFHSSTLEAPTQSVPKYTLYVKYEVLSHFLRSLCSPLCRPASLHASALLHFALSLPDLAKRTAQETKWPEKQAPRVLGSGSLHHIHTNNKRQVIDLPFIVGAPWGTRTPNLRIRSARLYPIELMAQDISYIILMYYIQL